MTNDRRNRAVWLGAAGLTLFIAWQTEFGPVLVTITSSHGIHLGDVLAGAAIGTGAWALTRRWN